MKKNGKDFKKEKNICGVMLEDEKKNCFLARRSVLWIFLFFLSFLSFSFAFSGPTQNPPSGNGTLQVDANQNFGIVSSPGDISPAQGTFGKVFTVASSSNPGISIFDVNDAKRFTWYVDSSGNLKLWYNTASSGADRLSVSSGGSITSYGPVYSANNPNYYIDPGLSVMPYSAVFAGNVGIGTTGPTRKLHIAEVGGSTDYGASIKLTNNSTGHLVTDGTDIGLGDGINLYLMNRENGSIKFGTNGAVVMTILNNGNVGIGTTNPSEKLEIDFDGTGKTISFYNWATYSNYGAGIKTAVDKLRLPSQVYFGDSSFYFLKIGLNGFITAYNDLQLGSSNGSRVYLYGQQSTGNIGIGTTTPAYKLDVQGGQVNSSGGFCIAGDCKTSWSQIQGTSYWALSGNYLYPTSTSYKVGISTTTPAYPLTVVGSSYISNSVYGGDYHSVNNTNYYIDPGLSVMPYSAVFAGNVGIGVSNPLAAIDISGAFYSRMVVKGNCSGAVTIDWSQGNTQHCVLTGNVTFTFINGRSGGNYRLVLKQDSTGGRTVSWPADVRWGAIGVPSLSVVPTKTDYIGFIYNGVDSTYDGVAFNSNY